MTYVEEMIDRAERLIDSRERRVQDAIEAVHDAMGKLNVALADERDWRNYLAEARKELAYLTGKLDGKASVQS